MHDDDIGPPVLAMTQIICDIPYQLPTFLDIVLFSLTIRMLQLFQLNPTIVFKSTTIKFIINFFFFLYNPYPHGYKNLVMEVHVWVTKAKCFHTRPTRLVLDIGSNSKTDLWLCMTCMYIYIYILIFVIETCTRLEEP